MNSVDESQREAWVAMQATNGRPSGELPLFGGGGGGIYNDMEARVAVLEAHMEHVRSDLAKLADVPEKLGRIEERLNALPDKDWIGAHFRNWIIGGVAVFSLISLAAKLIPIG